MEVKRQILYMPLLLEAESLSMEIIGMERVIEYMTKNKKDPLNGLHKISWEASKKIKNTE